MTYGVYLVLFFTLYPLWLNFVFSLLYGDVAHLYEIACHTVNHHPDMGYLVSQSRVISDSKLASGGATL